METQEMASEVSGIDESLFEGDNGVRRETEFPAVIEFNDKTLGFSCYGIYKGIEKIPQPPRPGEREPRMMISHVLVMAGHTKGLTFTRQSKTIGVKPGEFVSVAGQRLDRALGTDLIGRPVLIKYLGREKEAKKGRNPAHLFEVIAGSVK